MLYVGTGNCCRLFYSISLLAQRSEEFSSTDKDVFSGEVIHRRFFIYQNKSQGYACNQQD
ncbi:hypothetical protein C4K27_0736 [Pseudomonas chlororaphis subsp. chlororaphis]|nr:hypothetical protein C4K27_0736 [Pseudomonas chlororaphis subsp. chlororaphis]